MSEHRERVLRIERTFDAPANAVFEAWTSTAVLRRWLHAGPGWDTPIAEADVRVGGAIRIVMRNPQTGAEYGAGGQYRLIDPPRRLVFTWIWDHQPSDAQLIELEFHEQAGRTTVVMTNSSIPSDQARDDQRRGWQLCYDNLERTLAPPSSEPPLSRDRTSCRWSESDHDNQASIENEEADGQEAAALVASR